MTIDTKSTKKRISITKTQAATDEGKMLLRLCIDITNDGRISEEELSQLNNLLDTYSDSQIPALTYLKEIIPSSSDARTIYQAIEAILPVADRKQASSKRKLAEQAEKDIAKEKELAEKEQGKLVKKRNKPLLTANFMVAGSKYEGRPEIIDQYVKIDDDVLLIRDTNNKHSKYAVKVVTKQGKQIGFVPELDAENIAIALDQDTRYEAFFSKILGYEYPIPVVIAKFYNDDAEIQEATRPSQKKIIIGFMSVLKILAWMAIILTIIFNVIRLFLS